MDKQPSEQTMEGCMWRNGVADSPRPPLESNAQSPAVPGQRDLLRSCLLLLQKASFEAGDSGLACPHSESHLLHESSNLGTFPD